MILLFTDYGASDIYVGQVKAVLAQCAPGVPVIDLLHEVPPFNVRAGAHLLAALSTRLQAGDVVLAVVDPGVGGARDAIAVNAGGRWFVAPDNGLASVAAARANNAELFTIGWRPETLSASFHGRDLLAPVASMLAWGDRARVRLEARTKLSTTLGPEDLGEIVYLDHFGNAMTGLRACNLPRTARLAVAGRHIPYARVFSAAPGGEPFWYENSIGLAEIAGNTDSAARRLGLAVGQQVTVDVD
jgi:S-adenosylmethionine hydrolase